MVLYDYSGCGGWEFWLKFKQAEQECELGHQPESWQGETRKWGSGKKNLRLWSDLGTCKNRTFAIDQEIWVAIESSDDDKFCPKMITVYFDKEQKIKLQSPRLPLKTKEWRYKKRDFLTNNNDWLSLKTIRN